VATGLLALGWLFGLLGAAWAPGAPWGVIAAALLPPVLLRRPLPVACATAAGCAGLALLAMARWNAVAHAPPSDMARLIDAGPVRLTGVVRDDIDERGRSARFYVDVRARIDGPGQDRATGGVLVRVAPGRAIHGGDLIEVAGNVSPPPQAPDFDYRGYLARQGIDAEMDYPRVLVLGHDTGSLVERWLRAARRAAVRALDRSLPHPSAALARGIIIGDRRAIPADVSDDFNRSGASHLIAISGFNITILAGLIAGVLSPIIGRRRALVVGVAAITIYSVFVGLSPSVARALIMGGLLIGAGLLGRPGAPLVTLALAGALMTAQDPRVVNDAGFQLSFGATAGLMLLASPLQQAGEPLIVRLTGQGHAAAVLGSLWATAATTIAASIATLPVMLQSFGRLSLVAVPANLVLVPLFPFVMLTSGIAAVAGMAPPLAPIAGAFAWPPLAFTIAVAHTAARIPAASIAVDGPGAWTIMGLGGALVLLLFRRRRPVAMSDDGTVAPSLRLSASLLAIALPPALAGAFVLAPLVHGGRPDGRLTVTYFETAGAPAALVTGPAGERILVDTGPSGDALVRALDPLLPSDSRRLSAVILSRDAPMAAGALATAHDRYQPGAILAPEGIAGGSPGAPAVTGIPPRPGAIMRLSGGARIELTGAAGDPNRLAVVAVWGTRRIAVTANTDADIELERTSGGSAPTVSVAAAPALTYDVRQRGPVRASTDGATLRLTPAR
jgi:competence protein ComEC